MMVTVLDLFLLGIQQLSKKNIAKLSLYWKDVHTTNTTGSFVLTEKCLDFYLVCSVVIRRSHAFYVRGIAEVEPPLDKTRLA